MLDRSMPLTPTMSKYRGYKYKISTKNNFLSLYTKNSLFLALCLSLLSM